MSSFADQADYIRKKKEEILARKKAEAANPSTTSTSNKPAAPVSFANDGSFLAKFKAMQKGGGGGTTQRKEIKKEPDDVKSDQFANDGSFLEKFKTMQKAQEEMKSEPCLLYTSPSPRDS